MSPEILQYFPPGVLHQDKPFSIVDVGPDRFGAAFHPDLLGMLAPVVDAWRERGWDLGAKAQDYDADHA
jgi:hypothetical protein